MAGQKSKKQAEIAERRRLVAGLYLRHVHQADIARELGVDQGTVSRDITALKEEWRTQALSDVQDRVRQELAELDHLESLCGERFDSTGQVGWIAQRLAIKERRAKLLGLDAPKRSDVNVGMSVVKLIDREVWDSI